MKFVNINYPHYAIVYFPFISLLKCGPRDTRCLSLITFTFQTFEISLTWMNNAHKSLRKRNDASDTFRKCFFFFKVLSNFFIPESNGSAINSSSANRLCISSVLQKYQNEGPGNSGCFPYWWTNERFWYLDHISWALYRLTVYCCFLHKRGQHPRTALE